MWNARNGSCLVAFQGRVLHDYVKMAAHNSLFVEIEEIGVGSTPAALLTLSRGGEVLISVESSWSVCGSHPLRYHWLLIKERMENLHLASFGAEFSRMRWMCRCTRAARVPAVLLCLCLCGTSEKQNQTRSPGTAARTDTEKLKKGYQACRGGHHCPQGYSLWCHLQRKIEQLRFGAFIDVLTILFSFGFIFRAFLRPIFLSLVCSTKPTFLCWIISSTILKYTLEEEKSWMRLQSMESVWHNAPSHSLTTDLLAVMFSI